MRKRTITLELEGPYLEMAEQTAEKLWQRGIKELTENLLMACVMQHMGNPEACSEDGERPRIH